MTIRLSRLARQNLDDIRRYTLDTWGRGFAGLKTLFHAFYADSRPSTPPGRTPL